MKPTIVRSYSHCLFDHYFTPDEGALIDSDDYYFSVPESGQDYGKIVVSIEGDWHIESGKVEKSTEYTAISCYESIGADRLAFPIDPRMTEADITGATRVEANATNDGWLFFHDHESSHHDHLLAVDAAVAALFQPLVDAALYKVATATNAVALGKVDAKYKALIAFRDEVVASAQAAEKAHHVGHFVQTHPPEQGHVHKAVRLALSAAKVAFAASPEKAAQYRLISMEAAELITRMGKPHAPETRWDKAARIAAEEAAKKKAADQTPS